MPPPLAPPAVRATACAVLALAAIAAAFAPAAAQEVRLHGRVIENESESPIGDTRVTLLDINGRALGGVYTDEHGAFHFLVRRTDAVRLRAERIGYREALTPVLYFDDRDFFAVELRLDVEAVLLAPLEIVARSPARPSLVLSGFEDRRARGLGVFFTREDIERRRPHFVTDLLATVPGVRLLSSGPGSRRVVTTGRAPDNPECPAQLYIDGFHINRSGADVTIDDVVSPQSVEGIEVYRGLSTVPPAFLSPAAVCGVVVIWTLRGS